MVEKNLEEADTSQPTSLTSPKSVQSHVNPNTTESECNEGNNNILEKITNANFEAPMQRELPENLTLTDNKTDLQETSLEQEAPFGDSTTVSSEVDKSGLTSVKEDPYVFSSVSIEVDESKEYISGSIPMQSSGENTNSMLQTLVRLRDDVLCTPLHNVQDGACIFYPEKTACEMPPAMLTKVKEDKPRIMHRLHERQMSLGETRQKVSAPVSRSSSGKYTRTDKTSIDTTKPIESVKMAASRFGGSISWKARRTQPVQESLHELIEHDRIKKEISECKKQAEASVTTKASVFDDIERTKKLIEELKQDLERAKTEDAHAKEDFKLFQYIVKEETDGVIASDDNVEGKEILKSIQEQHGAVLRTLKLVKDEQKKVQENYDSLLIERDISIGKSQAAFELSKVTERQADELTVELNKLKGVLDLAHGTCHDAEEHKKCSSLAVDEDCLKWEKNLRQAEEELNQFKEKFSSVEDLKSKLETSSNVLLKCNNELTEYVEANLTEKAQEQGNKDHKSMQEEIILSRNELEENKKSIDKVRDEVSVLNVAVASLQSELSKEKAALASMQKVEAMTSITIQSLKVEIKLAQQLLEAVQVKEKESRDKMAELPKILQAAGQEADEAKSVAMKAREKLRKTKEEVEQTKADLSTMQFRLKAVLKEVEAAKESERLALDALRRLEESELALSIDEQGTYRMVTVDFDEHAALIAKCHQAEELSHEKTTCAIAQVEVAKESELLALSRFGETYKVLEERKRALLAAKKQADNATEGKLAMEQELRKWREENGRRRKAAEALISETKSSNTAVIIVEVSGDTKGTSKEDSCSLVHPLSDISAVSTPNDSALHLKRKKTKKPLFLGASLCFCRGGESKL